MDKNKQKRGGKRERAGRPLLGDSPTFDLNRKCFDLDAPENEVDVRERFRALCEIYGLYEVVQSQEAFPDLLLKRGEVLYRAEVELLSKSFQGHQHDINGCDLIICWRHNWPWCPLPVLQIAPLWYQHQKSQRAYANQQVLWEVEDDV